MTSTTSFPLYRTDRDRCTATPGCGRAHRHLRIALMGLGTVGQGLCRLLEDSRADLFVRHGLSFTITHVLVRNREEPRKVVPQNARLFNDAKQFLEGAYDLAVECMGGIEPAYTLTSSLLKKGIPVVSANKALLAEHGETLLRQAEKHDTTLRFEASVAAGIPILGVIERALQSMTVTRVCAILNGTSNYILTRMADDRLSLEDALTQAQKLGFAEADPSLDLTGMDAAQKLTVLARALGSELKTSAIHVQGLDSIHVEDCKQARAFGYALKPVAVADLSEEGANGFVSPALVQLDHPLAGVSSSANGVHLEGEPLGSIFLSGPGAGALPTAASILDDLLTVAKQKKERIPNPRERFARKTSNGNGRATTLKNGSDAPTSKKETNPQEKGASTMRKETTPPENGEARSKGWARNWFVSLRLPKAAASVEDILDFLAASGLVFRSLQEQCQGGHFYLAGITTTILHERLHRILSGLEETQAVDSYRAYPVVEATGKTEAEFGGRKVNA